MTHSLFKFHRRSKSDAEQSESKTIPTDDTESTSSSWPDEGTDTWTTFAVEANSDGNPGYVLLQGSEVAYTAVPQTKGKKDAIGLNLYRGPTGQHDAAAENLESLVGFAALDNITEIPMWIGRLHPPNGPEDIIPGSFFVLKGEVAPRILKYKLKLPVLGVTKEHFGSEDNELIWAVKPITKKIEERTLSDERGNLIAVWLIDSEHSSARLAIKSQVLAESKAADMMLLMAVAYFRRAATTSMPTGVSLSFDLSFLGGVFSRNK